MTCSTAYSCWLNTHPVVAWGLLIVLALLILGLIGYSIRSAFILIKMDREAAEQRAEEHRENEALSRRMWRTIRMGEEWGVDVRNLRQAREEFDFRRKAARVLYRQRLNIFFPLVPAGMLCSFLSFVLIPWIEWTAIAVFLLAAIWAVIQWGRYLWLRHLIKLVLADFARRSATSTPPDASAHA